MCRQCRNRTASNQFDEALMLVKALQLLNGQMNICCRKLVPPVHLAGIVGSVVALTALFAVVRELSPSPTSFYAVVLLSICASLTTFGGALCLRLAEIMFDES